MKSLQYARWSSVHCAGGVAMVFGSEPSERGFDQNWSFEYVVVTKRSSRQWRLCSLHTSGTGTRFGQSS